MKKALKIFFSVISGIIIFIVMVPILLAMLLQIGFVQKWAADTATQMLSEKAGTRFSISKIEIGLFNKAYFEDVYIAGPKDDNDTMLYVEKIDASINGINFFNGKISLGNVTLHKAKVYLKADSTGLMNVKVVFDHFSPKVPPKNQPNFRMSAAQVNLLDSRLTLVDDRRQVQRRGSINFQNMELNDITFQAQNVNIFNYDIKLAINHLSFNERSGFTLNHLSSPRCGVNETGMRYANLRLETPLSTLVCSHFNLLYSSWWDYNNFVNKVKLDAQIEPSVIAMPTIAYFIKEPINIPTVLSIQGSVVGTIPNLQGDLNRVATAYGTELSGTFNISGLPDIKTTKFFFNLNHLRTDAHAIDTLIKQTARKSLSPFVKQVLTQSGDITATGEFYGLLTDFDAKCKIATSNGALDANLKVTPTSNNGAIRLIGNVETTDFNLAQALKAPNLGLITMKAGVNAVISEQKLNLRTNATINSLDFKNYTYGPITMDGRFVNKVFTGTLCSDEDPNLRFHTSGTFDFTKSDLPAYDFRMTLEKANLVALGVNKRDSTSLLTADFKAHFTGTNIDNINGSALIDSIYYINHIDTVHTSAIEILSKNTPEQKTITLNSHFADIELQGKNSYSNIFGYLGKMARTYIPSFNEATEIVTRSKTTLTTQVVEKTYDDGYYTLRLKVKQANNVAAIFLPGLEIAQGTSLDFFFNPARNKFNFNLSSDYIIREDLIIEKLNIDSRNVADSLSIYLTTSEIDIGNVSLPNLSVIGGIKNNRIYLGSRFSDSNGNNSALINTTTNIYRTQLGMAQIAVTMHPSNIRINNQNWLLPQSTVLLDSTGVTVNNFNMRSGKEFIGLNGKIGKQLADTISLNVNDLNLSPLSVFVKDLGYSITGTASGNVKGTALLTNTQLFASLDFNDITFGGYNLGNSMIRSMLDSERKRIRFSLTTATGQQPVKGYYAINQGEYKFDIKFPHFDMVLLQPLLKDILTDTEGQADVNLTLSGGEDTPTLNGNIEIQKYAATVDFTKVRYTLAGPVVVKNNRFTLASTPIYDPEGHSGQLSAFFDSHYFKDLSFGINAHFNDLLALKTKEKDNPFFYGTGYGTGSLNINGTESQTKLNITAQTARNSSIVLPFSDISTVDRSTFISFVDPEKTNPVEDKRVVFRKKQRDKLQNELDITINLQVLPNTTAHISYSNSLMENIITGQGRGRLQMHINPSQEIFTIDGPMEIEKGTYRLIFAIADKTFTLQNGGRLQWTGSPSNPTVDFTGVYKVRTSLEPLTGQITSSNAKTTIDCGITLTETLFDPTISFAITAPSATPETQNILRNSLNTEEALSMQFFSLFLSGTFMPDMGTAGIGTMGGSILSTTGLEFLSNQIGSLISSKNFNIRPTFRPKSETNSEEVGVQASVSLLQDKIFIEAEGNYATSPLTNNQQSPFTGEGGVTVLLNKSGSLSLKGFTRIIDRFDETQGLQESGVGIYFRQGFQNWEDLAKKYREYLERVKLNKEQKLLKKNSKSKSQ